MMKKSLCLIVIIFFVVTILLAQNANQDFPWKEIKSEGSKIFIIEKVINDEKTECRVTFNGKDMVFINISYQELVPLILDLPNGKTVINNINEYIRKYENITIDSLGVSVTKRRSTSKLTYLSEIGMTKLYYFSDELKLLPEYIQKFLKNIHREQIKNQI
jgi:hypothetical protein